MANYPQIEPYYSLKVPYDSTADPTLIPPDTDEIVNIILADFVGLTVTVVKCVTADNLFKRVGSLHWEYLRSSTQCVVNSFQEGHELIKTYLSENADKALMEYSRLTNLLTAYESTH